MSAWNIFSGKNVVWSLVLLLAYLVYAQFSSPDSSLQSILHPKLTPIPTVSVIPEQNVPQVTSQAVQGASTGRQLAQVVKVIDGDTIDVEIAGVQDKIRIIGLNTPETVDPRRGVQCFGKEASNFAKQTLTGKTVYLEADPSQANRDKYQRLLRFVFLSEGAVDYGKLAIQEGYGYEYTYDLPYKYQKEYQQAQRDAQNAKKGLWAEGACK